MTLPATLMLDRAAVERLNWQPRYCPPPLECIAARSGDELRVWFGRGYDSAFGNRLNKPHRYQLAVLSETVLTGTLITEGNEHAHG
jgi:hypothetical protein